MMYNLQEDKEESLKIIEDLLKGLEASDQKKPNRFVITGGCIERGLVQFDALSSNFCTNPKCKMCSSFRKAIETYSGKVTEENFNQIKYPYGDKDNNLS